MPLTHMSVPERISAIKAIFNDFGICIPANSVLDQTIIAEFGRGKRSKLNQILLSLQHDTEAAELSLCIGASLAKHNHDPQIAQLSVVMCEHLPNLLHIIDIRQQTSKRIALLEQLLQHFESKLDPENQRLQRMLVNSRQLLRTQQQMLAMGNVIEHAGVV